MFLNWEHDMAEKNRYPQIPSTVWWGLWHALNRTPNAKFDAEFLGTTLDVQPVAAKAYVSELQNTGLLNDECTSTEIAKKWRLNETYSEAVDELLKKNYPQSLLDIVKGSNEVRQTAFNWFKRQGLGEGAAKNKSATFILIGSPIPGDYPQASSSRSAKSAATPTNKRTATRNSNTTKEAIDLAKQNSENQQAVDRSSQERVFGAMPLNINVQIHISAEAGSDQIESIFSAMKRYLYDK
jgi:hypothetical protein